MDLETLVRSVTEEVWRRLRAAPGTASSEGDKGKRILALFCGGDIGLTRAYQQVKEIAGFAGRVTVVASRAAAGLIGIDNLREATGVGEVVAEPDSPSSMQLIKGTDLVAIPVLTQNTAAKIALGIRDSLLTDLVAMAIIRGVPVIAARNAIPPLHPKIREKRGATMPEAYIRMLQGYADTLQSYGIQLVEVRELAAAVRSRLEGKPQPEEGPFLDKKVITVGDLSPLALPAGTRLWINEGSIITPLARDLAREKGITLTVRSAAR